MVCAGALNAIEGSISPASTGIDADPAGSASTAVSVAASKRLRRITQTRTVRAY